MDHHGSLCTAHYAAQLRPMPPLVTQRHVGDLLEGVGAGSGLAAAELVRYAVRPERADLTGGVVEHNPPVSFVDSGVVVAAET